MKRLLFIIILVSITWFLYEDFSYDGLFGAERSWMPLDYSKAVRVTLEDDRRLFEVMTNARTTRAFLDEQHIRLNGEDAVSGNQEDVIYDGKRIVIKRMKHVSLAIEGNKRSIATYRTDVEGMLLENNVVLGEDDFVMPKNEGTVTDGAKVTVVRVAVEEQLVDKSIAFEKTIEEDAKLSWRKTIVTQKGESGVKRFTYKVMSYDGKEVDRKLLKQEVTKEPVTEKTIQGTYVAVGKAHTGLGTWYAYTGTLAAASPWLPMGSYAKVTNVENGKSVIVKINDRGPFGKNRIIDLDKVAFAKIASIGAGIINTKVEEVTN